MSEGKTPVKQKDDQGKQSSPSEPMQGLLAKLGSMNESFAPTPNLGKGLLKRNTKNKESSTMRALISLCSI